MRGGGGCLELKIVPGVYLFYLFILLFFFFGRNFGIVTQLQLFPAYVREWRFMDDDIPRKWARVTLQEGESSRRGAAFHSLRSVGQISRGRLVFRADSIFTREIYLTESFPKIVKAQRSNLNCGQPECHPKA